MLIICAFSSVSFPFSSAVAITITTPITVEKSIRDISYGSLVTFSLKNPRIHTKAMIATNE